MKRFIALAAAAVSMLAVPATAMASTGTSAPKLRPVEFTTIAPCVFRGGPPLGKGEVVYVATGRPHRVSTWCVVESSLNGQPVTFVFDKPARGDTITEISGARLAVGEFVFLGRAGVARITAVHGHRITFRNISEDGFNATGAIRHGVGIALAGPVTISRVSPAN